MMTTDMVRSLLGDLVTAQHALRDSSAAFDEALVGLTTTLQAIAAANQAQSAAIDAVIAATERALQLVPTDGGAQ